MGMRGQNFARAGAKVSSTTYRDIVPPASKLHASPHRARVELIRPGTSGTDQPNDLKAEIKLFHWIIWGAPPRKAGVTCAASRFLRSRLGHLHAPTNPITAAHVRSAMHLVATLAAATLQKRHIGNNCSVVTIVPGGSVSKAQYQHSRQMYRNFNKRDTN